MVSLVSRGGNQPSTASWLAAAMSSWCPSSNPLRDVGHLRVSRVRQSRPENALTPPISCRPRSHGCRKSRVASNASEEARELWEFEFLARFGSGELITTTTESCINWSSCQKFDRYFRDTHTRNRELGASFGLSHRGQLSK